MRGGKGAPAEIISLQAGRWSATRRPTAATRQPHCIWAASTPALCAEPPPVQLTHTTLCAGSSITAHNRRQLSSPGPPRCLPAVFAQPHLQMLIQERRPPVLHGNGVRLDRRIVHKQLGIPAGRASLGLLGWPLLPIAAILIAAARRARRAACAVRPLTLCWVLHRHPGGRRASSGTTRSLGACAAEGGNEMRRLLRSRPALLHAAAQLRQQASISALALRGPAQLWQPGCYTCVPPSRPTFMRLLPSACHPPATTTPMSSTSSRLSSCWNTERSPL